ncbi:MAG: hypothetical protein C0614_06495 [Desulfuromonas sp.]|nr:MAG: hypothetical protein C0614_06495 [Desulfuromonas sp.]
MQPIFPPTESGPDHSSAILKRPSAIVVDDSRSFLKYITVLFNRLNIESLPVINPLEAIELARVACPNLLCLDLMLSGQNGIEILRQVRADDELADLPVLIVSGNQDKTLHWEALSLGCVDILDKPIDLRRLHTALQRCNLFGGKRRYLRAPFDRQVEIICNEHSQFLQSLTISERGIFVCSTDLTVRSSLLRVRIPLNDEECLDLGGRIIYRMMENENYASSPAGMAIKFDRMTSRDAELLTALVTDLLIGDIIVEQTEKIINPGTSPLWPQK